MMGDACPMPSFIDIHHSDFLLNLHTAVFSIVNRLEDSEAGFLSGSTQIKEVHFLKFN